MRFALLLAALCACGSKSTPSKLETKPVVAVANDQLGLGLVLANGVQGAPPVDHRQLAPAQKIDPSALFARAKPMQAALAVPAALRPASQPPPTTGEKIAMAFPSVDKRPPATTSGELHVLRYMPEGKLALAPRLTVTFDQPMSQSATAPIAITPAVPGHWRWIGARTAEFDPDGKHFPMATTYRVSIPAGTKSLVGTPLAKAVEFSFETPPPRLLSHAPDGDQVALEPPILLVFDQAVDKQAVLASLHVTEEKRQRDVKDPWKPSPMIDRKIAIFDPGKDSALQERISQLGSDVHWLTVRTVEPLSPNSVVTVEVPKGFASQEGPNRTIEKQSYTFSTYAPLALDRSPCSKTAECSPQSYFAFQFNNNLDEDAFKDDLVEVVPKIADLQIRVSYQHVILSGTIAPSTNYRVEFKAGLRDKFHQTLAHDVLVDMPVSEAPRRFWGANGTLILDPNGKPTLDYWSSSYAAMKVQLFKVSPDDYAAFEQGAFADPKKKKPGVALPTLITPITTTSIVDASKLDLSSALVDGRGSVVAIVEPSPWSSPDKDAAPPRYIAWAQGTHLAIDAHLDRDQLVIYASDLATGAPVQDVLIELRPLSTNGSARTDAKGIATIARPTGPRREAEPAYLIARHDKDVTILPGEAWNKTPRNAELVWHVFDDRDLYRPGEQVSIKGWMRLRDPNVHGDIGAATGVTAVHYTVKDSQNNAIGKGDANVNALGGFDLQFVLPNTPNLGEAEVELDAKGAVAGTTTLPIRIEEFRRPDFDASAHAQTTPFVVGGAGSVTVDAHYFSGGPLGGAKVNWALHSNPVNYRPPNRDDYVFGTWTPWWGTASYDRDREDKVPPRSEWAFEAKTDAAGEHVLRVETPRADKPYTVSAEATVTAPNSQTWSANTSFTVHPAALYVGLAAKAPFVVQGQPYELSVLGVDIDGKVAPGAAVTIDAVRVVERWKNGKRDVQRLDPQHCAVTTANDAQTCKLATPNGGEYTVTATISDDKGRKNLTEMTYWVTGGEPREVEADLPQQTVDVIPDKKEYVPGNTAELLVRAPFAPAEGTITYRRSGIVKTERISFTEVTKVVTVPITDDLVPNMFVQFDLVGVKKIAYAVGSVNLTVLPRERTLAVKVTPSVDKLAPGDKARVAVVITDAAGKPVANADVAVIVVDDSVLTLAGYQFADPIATFYRSRSADTSDYYTRAFVQVALNKFESEAYGYDTWTTKNSEISGGYGKGGGDSFNRVRGRVRVHDAVQEMPDPNGDRDSDGIPDSVDKMPDTAIAVRTNFNALAVFAGSVMTNADGSASVPVTMPDNLTRYRVIAVAAAGAKQFGKGESTMTARLPLMVRATPPRFLSFGDTFSLPVTLQNQTDKPMSVELGARAQNLTLSDGDGRKVTVPANDQVLVEIPMAAAMAGTARMQLVAASGDYSDAQELALPVWTPATTEAFATYGVIDNGAILQPVAVPPNVLPQFGGIEVSTGSTNLQALTDALIYLVHYPYECSEQRSSRVLAIASLKDVLAAFHSKDLPSPAALGESVESDVKWLVALQNDNGGFAYWSKDGETDPYVSVYVTYVLSRAKAKGYDVPAALFAKARRYLDHIEGFFSIAYTETERDSITAFAIYTRMLLGENARPDAVTLAKKPQLSVDATAWLIATFAGTPDAIPLERSLAQHISETADAASITSAYTHGYLALGSDTRSAGIALDALIADQPKSDLIPKLVTGLLASKKRGHWGSTQENGFVLAALDRYFHTYENITPNFTARVWLGADYAGDHVFKGRTTETASVEIPMAQVKPGDLVIQKDGAGRLYYRIGTSYAPADLNVEPADYGFVVERTYEPVDNVNDVKRDASGVWHVKVGARVRVKLSMVNDGQRHHVALVDPLPAGFEAVNPVLAGTARAPTSTSAHEQDDRYWWWTSAWYEHENLRDERVEAFAGDLWEGVHAYDYIARATTRGTFIAAAPKAEEMYAPETFGRGASERVIVE